MHLCLPGLRGLSRTGTSTKLPPAMPLQQARDGAGSDRLLRLRLKRLLNLGYRRHLSPGGASQERLEQGAFLREREILVTPPAFPRGLDGSHPPLLVGSHHAVDGRQRHAHRPCNILGFTRSRQSLVDDLPALAAPGALFSLHPRVHCVLGQMRGGPCNSASHQAVPPSLNDSFLEYHTECMLVGSLCTQPLIPIRILNGNIKMGE